MEPTLGCDKQFGLNKICRLKNVLYGMKQSPGTWFGRFTKTSLRIGYRQGKGNHTLFTKHSKESKLAALLVYVDNIIVTGDKVIEGERLKKQLTQEFEIKDLGKLMYFLAIEVAYSNRGISVYQRKYVLDLLKETWKLGSKVSSNYKLAGKEG